MKLIIVLISFISFTSTAQLKDYVTTPSGLKYKILKEGAGVPAKAGNEVLISNENTDSPVKVLIGGNQATEGVDEGLRGMRMGEIRQLIAAPNLVKRTSYPPNVSPDSTLVIKIILHKSM